MAFWNRRSDPAPKRQQPPPIPLTGSPSLPTAGNARSGGTPQRVAIESAGNDDDLPAHIVRALEMRRNGQVINREVSIDLFLKRLRSLKIDFWLSVQMLNELYIGTCKRNGTAPMAIKLMHDALKTRTGVRHVRKRPFGPEFAHLFETGEVTTHRDKLVMWRILPEGDADLDAEGLQRSRQGRDVHLPAGVTTPAGRERALPGRMPAAAPVVERARRAA